MIRVRLLWVAVALLVACQGVRYEPEPGVMTLAVKLAPTWVRNFNPYSPTALWPSASGIYEPLMVHNLVTGDHAPWLATEYDWSDDTRSLTFDIRRGVRWSDGEEFTAADVAFSFELVRRHPALDQNAVWNFIEAVEFDERLSTVTFRFTRPHVPGFSHIAVLPIVPQHIWSTIKDPVAFANPDPVATGPFTEVLTFKNQLYSLGRNPVYWQPGKPHVEVLRFPALLGNEQANLALLNGEVDWAGTFVPAIDRVFVDAEPEHNRYWYPLLGGMIFLYPNSTVLPLQQVEVRKALSMAIDRKRVVEVAMYDYTRPADSTGLSDTFAGWRDPALASAASWTDHDKQAARQMLDAAGFKPGFDGVRVNASGQRLEFELSAISGWSDWVRAAQVISRDLDAIGVRARVRLYDLSAWFERMQRGKFELAIGWLAEGATPYTFYRWLMSQKTVKPVGEPVARGNWHRFGSPEADEWLTVMESTTDLETAKAAGRELQRIFSEEAPAIPLFANPAWGVYRTERFENFPSLENPYGPPSPNSQPSCLIPLVEIRPKNLPVSLLGARR